jgi:hypothetical protein
VTARADLFVKIFSIFIFQGTVRHHCAFLIVMHSWMLAPGVLIGGVLSPCGACPYPHSSTCLICHHVQMDQLDFASRVLGQPVFENFSGSTAGRPPVDLSLEEVKLMRSQNAEYHVNDGKFATAVLQARVSIVDPTPQQAAGLLSSPFQSRLCAVFQR